MAVTVDSNIDLHGQYLSLNGAGLPVVFGGNGMPLLIIYTEPLAFFDIEVKQDFCLEVVIPLDYEATCDISPDLQLAIEIPLTYDEAFEVKGDSEITIEIGSDYSESFEVG